MTEEIEPGVPAPEQAPASETSAISPLDAAIEAWFVEQIHNSPVSRATDAFNHVRSAVDDLKTRLARL